MLRKLINKLSLFWLLQIGGWSVFFFIKCLTYYNRRFLSNPKNLAYTFFTFLSGFILTILFRIIYKKIKYQSRSILFLFAFVFFISLITANIIFLIRHMILIPLLWNVPLLAGTSIRVYFNTVFDWILPFISWSVLYFGIKFLQEWNIQKEKTEKANALAQSAQLQLLRYQLNPHFLFNSLNSIRALIEENKYNAKTMITELSEFLRYSLLSKNYSDVSFGKELEAIQHYLAIEKKRYEEKLDVTYEIDPEANDFPVLCFLIHPLVENAVKYGMRTAVLPLKIKIKAEVTNGNLKITVANSGKWVKAVDQHFNKTGTGTGLDNVQKRLKNAFADNFEFRTEEKDGFVTVSLQIGKNKE